MITPVKTVWQNFPFQRNLETDNIHIVWADFHDLLPHLQQFYEWLHQDEITRADQFVFIEDQQRFILARGFLRYLLGKYAQLPPQEIIFTYSSHGKPEISASQNAQQLHFNLSHAKDILLIALRVQHAVGIDVEFMRPETEILNLAQHYFSESEYQTLKNLPKEQQQQVFFQLWTRKEAVLKNGGMGLSYSLADVGVLLDDHIATAGTNFFVKSLVITEHYQAALSSSAPFTEGHIVSGKLPKTHHF